MKQCTEKTSHRRSTAALAINKNKTSPMSEEDVDPITTEQRLPK
jgi:hypothetical protein